MTMYIFFESVKVLMWLALLIAILINKNKIPMGLFWSAGTSSLLMALAGIQDIIHWEHLADKSGWWLVANIFIIITYYTFVKNSCLFHREMQQDIDTFLENLLKNKKNNNENSIN